MSRSVPERLFVLVHDASPANDGQALGGDRRAGDVAAQAFQAAPLMRLAVTGSMQGESCHPGQQRDARRCLHGRDAIQGKSLAQNSGPKTQLEDILAVYIDYALTHPNHYRMWFDTGWIRLEEVHLHMTHGRLQFLVYQNWLDSIEACQSDGLFSGWELLDVFQILWSRVHGLISLRLQHPDLPWMPVEQHMQGVLELGIKA